MAATAQEFFDSLSQSGLMSPAEIRAFREALPPQLQDARPEELAKEIVRQKKLTRFQATAIFQGRTGGLIFGKYEILDKIGVGGMGQVYRARDRESGRIVALKVLTGEARKSDQAIRRFQKEAETAGRLVHRNITATLEAGEAAGISYLVMEFIDGPELGVYIKERGPLPVAEVVGIIQQAAEGLEFAHRDNIVHRDVNPSNLLIDREGTVKILDLGLARIQDPDADQANPDFGRLTMAGQMLGTADYMSPEQVQDPRMADARSDVYSLGCTLYYLLHGKAPFAGATIAHLLMAHELVAIPPLAGNRKDVSSGLDAIYRKMLAKDAKQRYQSMAEVLAALKDVSLVVDPAEASVPAHSQDAAGAIGTAARERPTAAIAGNRPTSPGAPPARRPGPNAMARPAAVPARPEPARPDTGRSASAPSTRPGGSPQPRRSSVRRWLAALALLAMVLAIAGLYLARYWK